MSRDRAVRAAHAALAVVALAVGALASARAADAPASVVAAPDSLAPAPLIVAGQRVFVFRASFGSIHPEERRERAARMLAATIADMRTDSVHVDSTAYGPLLRYGTHPLFTVTPGDADATAGETVAGVTRDAARAITVAVSAGIRHRQPSYFAVQIGLALLATLLLIVLLRLLMSLDERVSRWMRAAGEKRLGRLAGSGPAAVGTDRVIHAVTTSVHMMGWMLSLLLVYLWLVFTLRRFPVTAPFGNSLRGMLWGSTKGVLMGVVHALPGLATVLVIALITRFAARVLNLIFLSIERGTLRVPWLHPDIASPTRRIANAVLWLFAFMAAYPFIPGSDTAVFKGASVLIGALLSFGSSGVVGQAMNGFVLMYSRSFKRGEYIHVGDVQGTVAELGLLSTKIVTPRNEELTIPNSLMVGSVTTNDSRHAETQGLYLNTTVTIGYDAPWRQVHALLIEAARRTQGLRQEPEPFVMQRALSDFYVEYVLAAQIEQPARRFLVLAELHQHIQDQFNEFGVQIMSPHYENDRTLGIPVVPKSKWYTPPAKRPETAPGA